MPSAASSESTPRTAAIEVRFCSRVLDEGCLDESAIDARFTELLPRLRREYTQPGAIRILVDGVTRFNGDDELAFLAGALCFAGVTALANGEAIETLYSTSSVRWRATPMGSDIELEDGFGGRIRVGRVTLLPLLYGCGLRTLAHLQRVAAHQPDLAAQLPYLERDAAAAKSALVSHGLA
jgi:hypothetical protein